MTPFKSIASTRDLPPAPSGWHPHGVTATGDGRVALLRAREPVPRGQPDAATLERLHRTNMRVSAFDGDEETEVVELPFLRFGRIVDRFEDGRWVVDGWDGLTGPADATRIHAPDGRLLSAFEIGGRHAACAGEHLWVGYGDEEIFGNDPDASAGLAAFDATGRCVHKFGIRASPSTNATRWARTGARCGHAPTPTFPSYGSWAVWTRRSRFGRTT